MDYDSPTAITAWAQGHPKITIWILKNTDTNYMIIVLQLGLYLEVMYYDDANGIDT